MGENNNNDRNNVLDENMKVYPLRKRRFAALEDDLTDGEVDIPGDISTSVAGLSDDDEGHLEDLEENYNSDDVDQESSDDDDVDVSGDGIFDELFNNPWDDKYNLPLTNFTGPQPGPVNIPDYINEHSTPLDFLNLFIGEDVYALLCLLTNRHANRWFEKNPHTYYAKVFNDNPLLDIDEMRAFVALRIMMEYLCYKPRYEAYWYGRNKNFVTQTPGFGDVMNRDRLLAIWTYLKKTRILIKQTKYTKYDRC